MTFTLDLTAILLAVIAAVSGGGFTGGLVALVTLYVNQTRNTAEASKFQAEARKLQVETNGLQVENNGARGTNWQLFVNELQEDRATLRAELTTATARLTALEARVQSTERLMGVMQADIQELVCGVETFAAQLCADGKDLRWQPSPGLLARYQIKVPPSGVSKP